MEGKRESPQGAKASASFLGLAGLTLLGEGPLGRPCAPPPGPPPPVPRFWRGAPVPSHARSECWVSRLAPPRGAPAPAALPRMVLAHAPSVLGSRITPATAPASGVSKAGWRADNSCRGLAARLNKSGSSWVGRGLRTPPPPPAGTEFFLTCLSSAGIGPRLEAASRQRRQLDRVPRAPRPPRPLQLY